MIGIVAIMNDAATGWGQLIWTASWQGGIALLLALVACRVLRDRSASLKCWLWRLAFCKLLIAGLWIGPIPLRWLPAEKVVVTESRATTPFVANRSLTSSDAREHWSPIVSPAALPDLALHVRPDQVEPIEPVAWLLLAWIGGVALCFANFVRNWVRLRRVLARCSAIVDGPAVDCLVDAVAGCICVDSHDY